jgi:hypothetical protein
MAVGIHCVDHPTPSIRYKLALTLQKSSSRSVGIVKLLLLKQLLSKMDNMQTERLSIDNYKVTVCEIMPVPYNTEKINIPLTIIEDTVLWSYSSTELLIHSVLVSS